jgi:hypothetical protein
VIAEDLARGRQEVAYEDWFAHQTGGVTAGLSMWPTMLKMLDTLCRDSPDMRDARELLYRQFLPSVEPVLSTSPATTKLMRFLAAEGAVAETAITGQFRISSELVRKLLIERVSPADRVTVPGTPCPFLDGELDIEALLRAAVPHISALDLEQSQRGGSKIAQVASIRNQRVAHEAAYHFALFRVLRSWLPADVVLLTEANAPVDGQNRARCDLVIEVGHRKVVLELCATAAAAEV